jgi:serine/threonine-protein kinase
MIAKVAKLPNEAERAVLLCEMRGSLLLLQRKYADVTQLATDTPDALMAQRESLADKYILLGQARRGLADAAGAKAAFTKAKQIIEASLTTRPDNVDVRVRLAHVLACLGEKERALAQTQVALDLLPVSKDAFHGPDILTVAAEIYVVTGEKERALQSLEKLLSVSSLVTAETLKLDPAWDPLRNEPRFQRLLTRRPQTA